MATYNVFDIEKDSIDLGPIGVFEIGTIHQKRHKKIVEHFKNFNKKIADDADVVTVAKVVGEILELLCVNATGVAQKLVELCDVDEHGEDALGINHLARMVEIILEITESNISLGNG